MFTFTLQYSEAMKIAKKLAHSVSKEETRCYLNGFYMHKAEDGNHYAVSMDGHMLTRIKVNPEYRGEFPAVIFPTQAINDILRLDVPKSEPRAEVIFEIDGLDYRIACTGQSFGGQLIDGTFPEYQRIIPDGWENSKSGMAGYALSAKYLAMIGEAVSYRADTLEVESVPMVLHFCSLEECPVLVPVVITEEDKAMLYVLMPMRAAA